MLERLSDQLNAGDVDAELLKRLGWTQDQLEQFVKRFEGPGGAESDRPSEGGQRRKNLTGVGKTTLREPLIRSSARRPGQGAADELGGNLDRGRTEPPPEFRDIVNAYRMSPSGGNGRKAGGARPK